MAEDNKYGRPFVHPAGVSVAFNPATGEWTKSDKKEPEQTTIQAAPVQVNVAPAAPANTVVETVVSTAETVGNAVASDLTSTVKDGVAMVNNAQDMVNMFIPGNNS